MSVKNGPDGNREMPERTLTLDDVLGRTTRPPSSGGTEEEG